MDALRLGKQGVRWSSFRRKYYWGEVILFFLIAFIYALRSLSWLVFKQPWSRCFFLASRLCLWISWTANKYLLDDSWAIPVFSVSKSWNLLQPLSRSEVALTYNLGFTIKLYKYFGHIICCLWGVDIGDKYLLLLEFIVHIINYLVSSNLTALSNNSVRLM